MTSVVTGNCSLSLFPMTRQRRSSAMRMFCDIEDMPEHTLDKGVPWSWEGYDGYRETLERGGLAVHTAALIGHSTLRIYALGEAAWERPSSAEERAALARALDACLAAGAFGFSTSYHDRDRDNRLVPSALADDAELVALLDVLGRRGAGLVEFIPNQGKEDPTEDVRRVAGLCAERDLTCAWNGLVEMPLMPQMAQRHLDCAQELQERGVRVYPQVTPRTIDFNVNWDRTVVFRWHPKGWHRLILTESAEEKRAMLADAEWRRAAREEWDTVEVKMFPVDRPRDIRFVSVERPELEPWLGRSLEELAAERGGHLSDVLADWVLENDLRPGVVAAGIANANVDAVAEILTHPATVISASDSGAHVQMMCAAGDTTLLLTRHVKERGDLSLEQAVHELTGRQADLFGFGRRGRIAPGWAADLTVFSLDELHWDRDVFASDLPGGASRLRRPPGGYRYTVVSGEITQEAGALTGARPARTLDPRSAPS